MHHVEQVQRKAAIWDESNWDYKKNASNMVQNLSLNSLAIRGEIACLKKFYSTDSHQKIPPDSVIPKCSRWADFRFKPIIGRVQAYWDSLALRKFQAIYFLIIYNNHKSLYAFKLKWIRYSVLEILHVINYFWIKSFMLSITFELNRISTLTKVMHIHSMQKLCKMYAIDEYKIYTKCLQNISLISINICVHFVYKI